MFFYSLEISEVEIYRSRDGGNVDISQAKTATSNERQTFFNLENYGRVSNGRVVKVGRLDKDAELQQNLNTNMNGGDNKKFKNNKNRRQKNGQIDEHVTVLTDLESGAESAASGGKCVDNTSLLSDKKAGMGMVLKFYFLIA